MGNYIQCNLDFSLKLQIIESSFESESGAEEPSREEPTDNDSLAVPLATQQVHYL
jgi:hypothetical protein